MIKWFPIKKKNKKLGVSVCLDYPEFRVVFCLFVCVRVCTGPKFDMK